MNWYIKTFRKRSAVKILLAFPDKRLKEYWRIPKGNQVKVKNVGIFNITLDEAVFTGKNIPTFIYNDINASPHNLYGKQPDAMTPEDFLTAIDAQVASEIFASTRGGAISTESMIILGAILISAAGVYYMLGEKIEVIRLMLESLGIGG